jgi:hypothetical protein
MAHISFIPCVAFSHVAYVSWKVWGPQACAGERAFEEGIGLHARAPVPGFRDDRVVSVSVGLFWAAFAGNGLRVKAVARLLTDNSLVANGDLT